MGSVMLTSKAPPTNAAPAPLLLDTRHQVYVSPGFKTWAVSSGPHQGGLLSRSSPGLFGRRNLPALLPCCGLW